MTSLHSLAWLNVLFILISDTYDVVTCLGGFDIGNYPTSALTELVKMAKPGKRAL